MASRAFFDPMKLLRLAPLITSTGTLVYATSELLLYTAFLDRRIRRKSDEVLPVWLATVFRRVIWLVVGLITITTSTAAANALLDRHRNSEALSTKFYWCGFITAIGHLLFVPAVAGPLQDIFEDRAESCATSQLDKWLQIHRVRMVVADFPAWLSCLGAVMTRTSL